MRDCPECGCQAIAASVPRCPMCGQEPAAPDAGSARKPKATEDRTGTPEEVA